MGLKRQAPEMGDGGGNPPMGDGGGEGARMGLRSGMNEVKVEYELQNCTANHDTCFNLESTGPYKAKGCGTLKTLVSDVSGSALNSDDLSIKQDECKKISGAANKKWKKALGFDDETIKRTKIKEPETMTISEWTGVNTALSYAKKYRLKTLCTCSEDGCNGGNKIEAKFYIFVITAFIISKMFSS